MINVKKNCWLCGPCNSWGNPWELAAFLNGLDLQKEIKAVVAWLKEHGLLKGSTLKKSGLSGWQRIWHDTVSAADCTAQPLRAYLAIRGLNSDDIPNSIRFHPALEYYAADKRKVGEFPALLAAIRDAAGPKGVLRIYLTQDGHKANVEQVKKVLGKVVGCAIHLDVPTTVLNVGEGPETSLAIRLAIRQPTWSTISAPGMKALTLPAGLTCLHIWADTDLSGAGLKAATALALKAHREGLIVFIHIPPGSISSDQKSRDWLDEYNDHGADFLRQELDRAKPWSPPEGASLEDNNPNDFPTFHVTDSGNAELFAHLYSDRFRYDHRRKTWLIWRGHWWGEDEDGEVDRATKEATRMRYLRAANINESDQKAKEAIWSIKSEDRRRREAMIQLAKSEHPITDSGGNWDLIPWLFGVSNGVIDLKTGLLREGRREDRITQHTPIAYIPMASCPRWEQFLMEILGGDAEMIGFLHRAIGYSLTGMTTEQVLFLLVGSGSNGKNVLLNTILKILGMYGCNTPFSTFHREVRSSASNDVAALIGKRFVTSSETNEDTHLNEARIKELVHGDPTSARYLFKEFFSFRPVAKFWLAVNHMPQVIDDSHGFWRSVYVVPFATRFVNKRPDELLQYELPLDKELENNLIPELEGILAWAVRGCLEWQKCGLMPPGRITRATQTYKNESDPLDNFLLECCLHDPSYSVRALQFHTAYLAWAKRHEIPPEDRLSLTAFGSRMTNRYEKKSTNTGAIYTGVGLRDEHGVVGFGQKLTTFEKDVPGASSWVDLSKIPPQPTTSSLDKENR